MFDNHDDILRALGLTPEILAQMGLTARVVRPGERIDTPVIVGVLEDEEIFTQRRLMIQAKELNRQLSELDLKRKQIKLDLEAFNLALIGRLGITKEDFISTTLQNNIVIKKSAAIREGLSFSQYTP